MERKRNPRLLILNRGKSYQPPCPTTRVASGPAKILIRPFLNRSMENATVWGATTRIESTFPHCPPHNQASSLQSLMAKDHKTPSPLGIFRQKVKVHPKNTMKKIVQGDGPQRVHSWNSTVAKSPQIMNAHGVMSWDMRLI